MNYSLSKFKVGCKLATVALAALFITSCTQSNSQLSATDQILQIQETNKKLLAEHQESIKKQRQAFASTNTSALAIPVKPKVVKKSKPKVRKASVAGSVRPSNNITQRASLRCSPKRLKTVIYQVARKFGHVIVNSTGRSNRKNRLVGGAKRSYHLNCQAIDFRVRGNNRGLYRYLRNHPNVGGLKRYRSGYYHIDTGPRRSW